LKTNLGNNFGNIEILEINLNKMNKQKCYVCNKIFPLSFEYFAKKNNNKTGFENRCKTCKKLYNKYYYKKNKKKISLDKRKYFQENKEKRYVYEKNRKQKDPIYKLAKHLRSRLWDLLRRQRNIKETSGALKLLGCSVEELWNHLEKQFKPGMTKHNHGLWHIDHIKPCISFNLTDEKQKKECFHYTNLQPLWAKENLIKGSKKINNVSQS